MAKKVGATPYHPLVQEILGAMITTPEGPKVPEDKIAGYVAAVYKERDVRLVCEHLVVLANHLEKNQCGGSASQLLAIVIVVLGGDKAGGLLSESGVSRTTAQSALDLARSMNTQAKVDAPKGKAPGIGLRRR